MSDNDWKLDPQLDLVLERIVDITPEEVWRAWTTPELLKEWFTPAPWQTVECQMDLRPGGLFRTVMRSPEGKDFPNVGSFLEVVPNRRLVWTNTLEPDYRPAQLSAEHPCDSFFFCAILEFKPQGTGTRYTALVRHGDPESCRKHREMGFEAGWSAVLDQLVQCMKKHPA